jgi:hypothetical protein
MSLISASSKPFPALPLAADLAAFLPVAFGAWATTAGFLAGAFAGAALAAGFAGTLEAGLATDLAAVFATGLEGDLATGLAGALATVFAAGLAVALGATLGAVFVTALVGVGFLDFEAVGIKTPELQMKHIFHAGDLREIELERGKTLKIRQGRWANIWCAVLAV